MLKWKMITLALVLLTCTILLVGSSQEVLAEQPEQTVEDMFPKEKSDSKVSSVKDLDEEESANVNQTNSQSLEENSVGLGFGDYFKMIFALLFVVALLYGLLHFINKKNKVYQHGKIIENMGGASLGSNRSVQMVRIGEKILVLGVAENIQLLNIVEKEDEFNAIIDDYNNRMEQTLDPKDIITKLANKWKRKSKSTEQSSFAVTLKKELGSLSENRKKWMEDMKKKGNDSNE